MARIDFTPIDFTPTPAEPDPIEGKKGEAGNKVPAIQFTPIDFTPTEPQQPTVGVPEDRPEGPSAVEWEAKGGKSFFDRPGLLSKGIAADEIADIARRHGVDASTLREALPLLGGSPAEGYSAEDAVKRAVGFLGESVGLGLPQKAGRALAGGELEKALDELNSLAQQRKSYTVLGAEMATPGGLIGKIGKGSALVGGAIAGALSGLGGSTQGQELESTVFGGLAGGALGGLLGRVFRRGGREAAGEVKPVATAAEEQVIKQLETEAPNIERGAQEYLEKAQASEQALEDYVLRGVDLDENAASRIIREQGTEEVIEARLSRLDPSTEQGQILVDRIARKQRGQRGKRGKGKQGSKGKSPAQGSYIQTAEKELAEEIATNRTKELAEDLVPGSSVKNVDEARKVISEWASREGGEEAVAQRYQLLAEREATGNYIQGNAIRLGREGNAPNKILNGFSDAQFVLADVEQSTGVPTEMIHKLLNRRLNRMSFPREKFRGDLNRIYESSKAIDGELTNGSRIIQAVEEGAVDTLSPAEQAAVKQFSDYFEAGLDFVNRTAREGDPDMVPLSIPRRANYIPRMFAKSEKVIAGVEERLRAAGVTVNNLARMPLREFRDQLADDGPLREVADLIQILSPGEITSPADLASKLRDNFFNRKGRIALSTKAKAAMERTGNIPEWARETNLYILADKWMANTLRHLYLREPMQHLQSLAKQLKMAGAEVESRYVNNILQDLSGIREGTAASLTADMGTKYQRAIDKLLLETRESGEEAGVTARVTGAVLKAVPEILKDVSKQIYPNLLGLRPKAIIMNLMQPFVKTAPELGTPYGYTAVLKATMSASKQLPRLARKVEAWGYSPANMIPKYRQAVSEGIRRSAGYAIPLNVANRLGDAAMYFYTKSDVANRIITVSTAERMAYDIGRGSKKALSSLERFPPKVQQAVLQGVAEGNVEAAERALADHLMARTQYHYNRASMSEYGRIMGPLFSTFTKWPLATAGDIIQEYRSKGALRGTTRVASKFLYPLLMLQGADYLLSGGDEDNYSDIAKNLLGSGGLSGNAPLGTITPILEGDFFTPPVIDLMINGILRPALKGDGKAIVRGLANAVEQFTPAAGWVRFLTRDMVTYMTGRKPEGKDFLERTVEGARILEREVKGGGK